MADFLCHCIALQPMHVGFTSDQGGNSIELRWFRHKSNLHHVINDLPHDPCLHALHMIPSVSVIISLIIPHCWVN